jgi:hypothetical protein
MIPNAGMNRTPILNQRTPRTPLHVRYAQPMRIRDNESEKIAYDPFCKGSEKQKNRSREE